MQKKLIALAVASLVSAPVFAQSQVTLYGTFDAGVRNDSNVDGKGGSKLSMDSSGTYNSNRWGMKGSEDLGNGLKANFNLEGGFKSGSGDNDAASTAIFRRKAIVGLSGNWGALDLGRNYTALFYTVAAYDPFNYKYTGVIPLAGLDGARHNNDIQFTSNSMNGFKIRVDHSLGEVVDSTSQGSTDTVAVSYANGPLSAGAAYGVIKGVNTAATAASYSISQTGATAGTIVMTAPTLAANGLDAKQWTIGGAYDFNPFRVAAGYHIVKADNATGGSNDLKNYWLGGSYKMSGANALTLAYYKTDMDAATAGADGDRKLWVLGFVHNLSKRTEFYAGIDSAKYSGAAFSKTQKVTGLTADTKNTGISIGINHAF